MNIDDRLSKVEILVQQKKYSESEKILKDLLAEDPNNVDYLAMMAEVYLQADKPDQALDLIDRAISITPDLSMLFYTRSRVFLQKDKYDEAEKNIDRAIEMDPYDADYFALSGNIKLLRKKYKISLKLADRALEIDPENLLALNTRSTALLKLNKKEESFDTIEGALREDPNNAFTHANYGWGLLEKGDHKKALKHFNESLKNDPNYNYAQAGVVEALKASNPVYRLFLKYSFWMSKLTAKYQWGVIIGFYLGFRALSTVARNNEALKPYLTPLLILLAFVAFSTWIINPIGNLFLRFNKYGNLLLDRKEKRSSNFVAISFLLLLVGGALYFILNDDKFLTIAVFGFAMMLPFGVMFSPSKYKNSLLFYALAMTGIGLASVALTFSNGEIFNMFTGPFILAFIGFQWVANFLIIQEDNV